MRWTIPFLSIEVRADLTLFGTHKMEADQVILEVIREVLYAYRDGHSQDFINALKLQFAEEEREHGSHP
jgi:hypothetical protein